jgi:Ca2+-binding EF-hand superfamily protein
MDKNLENKIKECFDFYDKTKKGFLDFEYLEIMLNSLGYSIES